jgi:hypothetical protein
MVRKVICAFTAATRASDELPFTKYYESGQVEAELVPQGTLAERMRAAGPASLLSTRQPLAPNWPRPQLATSTGAPT